LPGGVELVEDIVRVEVPNETTLVGFSDVVRPAGLVADNTMVPVKPPNDVTVIVEVTVWPARKKISFGIAVMPKHGEAVTLTKTTVE